MAGAVQAKILGDSNLMNLKSIPVSDLRKEISMFLNDGETFIQAFQTIRDQVAFTNKRVIVANVQGITGKKISYFSYPYSKVQYFGIETAGLLDIDSELSLVFADGANITFDFKTNVDIKAICSCISDYVL